MRSMPRFKSFSISSDLMFCLDFTNNMAVGTSRKCPLPCKRVPRKLEEWQPNIPDKYPIRADLQWWRKACGPGGGHKIILLHPVAADTEAADQLAISIERHATREEHDAALIEVGSLASLPARRRHIIYEKREERTRGGAIDPGRVKGLSAEAYGAIGNRRPERDAGKIFGDPRRAAEVDHVSGLGDGDIYAEDGGIRHAEQAQDLPLKAGDCNHHPGRAPQWEPDRRPCLIGEGNRLIDDLLDLGSTELSASKRANKPSVRGPSRSRTIQGPNDEPALIEYSRT